MTPIQKEILRHTLQQPVRAPLWQILLVAVAALLVAALTTVGFALAISVALALVFISVRTGRAAGSAECPLCRGRGYTVVPLPGGPGEQGAKAMKPCAGCAEGRRLFARIAAEDAAGEAA